MKALVVTLLLSSVAAAASPTVAVMPFRDLSGGKGSIGEAIRETVTSDLKDVPGLKIIERGNIDKVLAEQNLQASRADLDPTSSVKVGKLLGATLIVTGAYQRAEKSVRLTARFVKVETGEIVGTAKVDGAQADFLSLQDRITVDLLKSAGIESRHVQKFAARPRPKVKSLKTVELYGDAVVEKDDNKRQEILVAALNEDPSFVYAARDLDALEKRLKALEAAAKREQEKGIIETRDKIAKETDPQKKQALQMNLLGALMTHRRYAQLVVESRAIMNGPPPGPNPYYAIDELAGQWLVTGLSMLKQRDAVLREGEAFLNRYPRSQYFNTVKMMMQTVIDEKRKEEEGKTEIKAKLADMGSRSRWDLCHVARIYQFSHLWKESIRLFRACIDTSAGDPANAWQGIVYAATQIGDWPLARKAAAEFEKQPDKNLASSVKAMMSMVPVDN
jgi:TolB-like protein